MFVVTLVQHHAISMATIETRIILGSYDDQKEAVTHFNQMELICNRHLAVIDSLSLLGYTSQEIMETFGLSAILPVNLTVEKVRHNRHLDEKSDNFTAKSVFFERSAKYDQPNNPSPPVEQEDTTSSEQVLGGEDVSEVIDEYEVINEAVFTPGGDISVQQVRRRKGSLCTQEVISKPRTAPVRIRKRPRYEHESSISMPAGGDENL